MKNLALGLREKLLKNPALPGLGRASKVNGDVLEGGGVSSWNDLQGKPFGEEGICIEWDGVIGDRASVTVAEEDGFIAKYVKVAPPISKEELVGATITKAAEGTEVNVGQINDINVTEYNGLLMVNQILMVVPAPYSDDTMTISEAGVYFYCITAEAEGTAAQYVSKFEKNTVKTIDPKYIPESAHYLTDANGVQYKLTVGTDGTLSAVAVK